MDALRGFSLKQNQHLKSIIIIFENKRTTAVNADNPQQFSIGKFDVDISRSQICDAHEVIALEPKVLQVLLILARNQGQVVSHETLRQNVWPGVVVTPGALQRCIAQLRKVLGDDAKKQSVISTQPKVGYSLLIPVKWHYPQQQKKTAAGNFRYIAIVAALLLLVFVFQYTKKQPSDDWKFHQLKPLTATDHREFFPSFSPDGQYIAFQRYISDCERQLWAKDLNSNKEYLLTAEPGFYGPPRWSPNGQSLAFTNVSACGQKPGCRNILGVSFALAKTSPQVPHEYVRCQQESYGSLSWLNESQLAFVAKRPQQTEVRQLDLSTQDAQVLYRTEQAKPYHLSYSEPLQKLLVMQHDALSNSEMVQLDLHSGAQETTTLQVPSSYQDYIWWRPEWHPHENRLLAGAGQALFAIKPNGQMQAHVLTTLNSISHPVYHPNGQQIAATLGRLDLDIGRYHWQVDNTLLETNPQDEVFARSTQQDYAAQYEPGTNNVAWISERTGVAQIWLESTHQPRQLSRLSSATPVIAFRWSNSGQFILLVAGHQLHILNLNGELEPIKTEFQVLDVYQSVDEHRYLLSVAQGGQRQLIIFDINNQQQEHVFSGYSTHAHVGDDTVFIVGKNKTVGQLDGHKIKPVKALQGITTSSGVFYRSGEWYVFSNRKTLISYDPISHHVTNVATDLDHIQSVTDVSNEDQQLLYTTKASHREEVVLIGPE